KRPHRDESRILRAIAAAGFGIRGGAAWLEKSLHTALAIFARFHPRYPAGQIDHQLVTPQHVRALCHYDRIACQRDSIAFMSNMPSSPVAVWSFCMTPTLPRASNRLMRCSPPGPGEAACMVLLLAAPSSPCS